MSIAYDLIKQGLLPEDDKAGAIAAIYSFPLDPMEKKYIYIDYAKIYKIEITKDDVTMATGRSDI